MTLLNIKNNKIKTTTAYDLPCCRQRRQKENNTNKTRMNEIISEEDM